MLKAAHTAVVERNVALTDGFRTEPYETAWATEVRWFVHVLDGTPEAELKIQSQTSPEGLTWCDHEIDATVGKGLGLITLAVRSPGPWQRLRISVHSGEIRSAIVYLCLAG